jgi:enterochelin esterase-like enzyme
VAHPNYHHSPANQYAQAKHPRTWPDSDVVAWLQSKNVAEYIIGIVRTEGITGRLLLHLSKDDMATMGVRLFRERLELDVLIQELKDEWRIEDRTSVSDRAHGRNVVGGNMGASQSVMMGEGKASLNADLPPSYNP